VTADKETDFAGFMVRMMGGRLPAARVALRAALVTVVAVTLGACASGRDAPTAVGATNDDSMAIQVAAAPIDSALGSYLAGRVARHERDTAAAARYFARALADDPDNVNILRQTALSLLAEGRVKEAAELSQRIIALRPRAPVAGLTVVVDRVRAGDYEAARKLIDTLPRQGYNTLLAPLISAWVSAAQGRYADAFETLDKLNQSSAFTVFREYHTALIHDLAGNTDLAEAAYRRALDSQRGGSYRLVSAFGAFYERTGRPEKARALYTGYLRDKPDSLWLAPALARLDRGEAPDLLVRDAREGVAEALVGTASALNRENALDAALLYDRLALYLRPGFDLANLLLGEIYDGLDQPARAIVAYEAVPASSPLRWSAALRIAIDLDATGRTDEAIDRLNRMASERPTRADALITLGDILRGRERWADAVDAYDRALARIKKRDRRHWRALYARGISLERSKRWKRAEKDFLAALDLAPDQPLVLNYLGYSWVDQGINLDRALKMIERAVELRPRDGYIIDSLGWAQYRLGNYASAVIQLERAVELQPDDPTINDHLGDAYWRAGRKIEARFQWRRALALNPPEEGMAARIERKLRVGLPQDAVADGSG